MTDATVNVLPDPVTPRSVVWARPAEIQSVEPPDGARLVPLRGVVRDEPERRHPV